MTRQPDIVGGITDAEASAIARGVREMAFTIRGLREDLARVERARAEWAGKCADLQRQLEIANCDVKAASCICTEEESSGGSATLEDNPTCPIHGSRAIDEERFPGGYQAWEKRAAEAYGDEPIWGRIRKAWQR